MRYLKHTLIRQSKRGVMALGLVASAVLLSLFAGPLSPAAHAAGSPNDPKAGTGVTKPNLPDPKAEQRVRLMPRADDSRKAWDEKTKTYSRSYANPVNWTISLDGCSSRGGARKSDNKAIPVTGYQWKLDYVPDAHGTSAEGARPAALPTETVTSGLCRATVNVKALGRWHIKLTIRTGQNASASAEQTVTLRDKLIVALGDSYASGEGNPDRNQKVEIGEPFVPARWYAPACHRSKSGWPARVASAEENDTTSVTFLNFACSGAHVANLINEPQKGQDPQLTAGRPGRSAAGAPARAPSARRTRSGRGGPDPTRPPSSVRYAIAATAGGAISIASVAASGAGSSGPNISR